MKRLSFAVALTVALLNSVSGMSPLESLTRQDARSLGSGGASLLFSTGYDSFFGNPAGFSGPGSLTLGDLSLWGYMPMNPGSINSMETLSSGYATVTEAEAIIDELLTDNSELGFGGAVGLGWAGKGLGLGANLVSEALLSGTKLDGSRVIVRNQVNAIVGFGLPIKLGLVEIAAGADVRAFYRLDSVAGGWADGRDLVLSGLGYYGPGQFENYFASEVMSGGIGYAFDAGATLTIGPLSAGFMARDLFGSVALGETTVYDIEHDSDFPTDGTDVVELEPTYTAGLALKFNQSGLVAPAFFAETDDIPGFLDAISTDIADTDGILATMKAGAELRLLRIFILRGGLNKNLLSLGAGIDLYLIRGDIALSQEDIGGLTPRTGISARVALKL